jgi:hypothetical protein
MEAEVAANICSVFLLGHGNGGATSLLIWLIGLEGALIGGLGMIAIRVYNSQRP